MHGLSTESRVPNSIFTIAPKNSKEDPKLSCRIYFRADVTIVSNITYFVTTFLRER